MLQNKFKNSVKYNKEVVAMNGTAPHQPYSTSTHQMLNIPQPTTKEK